MHPWPKYIIILNSVYVEDLHEMCLNDVIVSS